MEGYLIRLPVEAWVGDGRTHENPSRPTSRWTQQAQVMYYELGEGYLQGYADPNDTEPLESFQLTSHDIQVDPMYSMHMFQVFATPKSAHVSVSDILRRKQQRLDSTPVFSDCSENEEEDDDDGDDTTQKQVAAPSPAYSETDPSWLEPSLILFAVDRENVEKWCRKLLNWNRYVFGSSDMDEMTPKMLAQAKQDLITSFQKNTSYETMFSRALPLNTTPRRRSSKKANAEALAAGDTATQFLKRESLHEAMVSKPWFLSRAASSTRRISSHSLRKVA